MLKRIFVNLGLASLVLFSTPSYAGVLSGKIALVKNYNNKNVVFQLYQSINPAVTYKGSQCLIEDMGRGAATVFQLGIVGDHLEHFYSQILMAQASKKDIKIEFTDAPQGYCVVNAMYTFYE